MANKLLIRSYNVAVGDFFYLRIPDGNSEIHVLIDCGSKGDVATLKAGIEHLKTQLPAGSKPGKKRLDLVVATHRHEDHIKGFDPAYFNDIEIGHLWMSPMMNPKHPQAGKSLQLEAKATQLMREVEKTGLELSPELSLLASLYSIDNEGAENALRTGLPLQNQITPKYVFAGQTAAELGLQLQDTQITVLGPENDIDHFYLGKDADQHLNGLAQFESEFTPKSAKAALHPPFNINASDFRMLQSRVLSDALAFANEASEVVNNSSVVLLFEWKKRRLLFVGDAEWTNSFAEGRKNGSWNVVWSQRRNLLNKPLDFLKIGHHGSINATPFDKKGGETAEVNQILDAILPIPAAGTPAKAKAVVSTARTNYISIPEGDTLVELGKRVANTRNYKQALKAKKVANEKLANYDKEKPFLGKPQPHRTDFEYLLNQAPFMEIEFDPGV